MSESVLHTSAGMLTPSGRGCQAWIRDGMVRPSSLRMKHSGRMLTASSVPTSPLTADSSMTRSWRQGISSPRRSCGGQKFSSGEEVVAILQKKARVQGVKLRTGSVIDSPIVVNVAGPHSSRVNSLAGVPIYDRTSLGGFYVAIGTSRNQFKNAPVVGRFMATLICACGNGHDHDADPVVVQGRFTRNAINLGHCSRLRQPHADSAFNVMG